MNKKLYVGNIPYQTSKEDLVELFRSYGSVIYIKFPKDNNSLNHKGYAFIEMSTIQEANQALKKLHRSVLIDRKIIVSPAVKTIKVKSNKIANNLGVGICLFCSSHANLFGYNQNIKGICSDCIEGLKKALINYQKKDTISV